MADTLTRLVVNADDLGISRGTNLAIADGFRRGIVTSASLMVNMPAFEDAITLLREEPELQVGLHLCLTSGRSVLQSHEMRLLVDGKRRFRHSFFGLWRLLRSRHREAALAQIEAELYAQWELGRQNGVSPKHLDSHQHVHMIPGIFRVVAQLAHTAGLPLRVSHEPLRITSLAIGPNRIGKGASGLVKAALLAHFARGGSNLSAEQRRSNCCFGIVHSGRMTSDVLMHIFASLPRGVVEIITHPSWETCNDGNAELSPDDRRFLLSPFRRLESNALTDPRVRQAIERQGVQLCRGPSYRFLSGAA